MWNHDKVKSFKKSNLWRDCQLWPVEQNMSVPFSSAFPKPSCPSKSWSGLGFKSPNTQGAVGDFCEVVSYMMGLHGEIWAKNQWKMKSLGQMVTKLFSSPTSCNLLIPWSRKKSYNSLRPLTQLETTLLPCLCYWYSLGPHRAEEVSVLPTAVWRASFVLETQSNDIPPTGLRQPTPAPSPRIIPAQVC